MSALGQKQTFGLRNMMSALPPKADIAERDWDVRFVPKADIPLLFDHLVSTNSKCGGDFEAKGFGSREVNDKLDVGRKFDW